MKKKTSVWVLLLAVAIVTAGCETGSQTSSETGQTAQNEQKGVTSAQANGSGTTVDTPKTGGQATTDTTIAKVRMDNITALRLIDGQSGWIGGNGWIARTDAIASDSVGSTWNVQYQGQGTVQQIFALNGQQAWAVMADSGSLLATRDGGKRWEVVGTVPEQGQAGFLHFVSSKEGFSGNQYTKDGGQSWSSLPVPGHLVGQPYYHDQQNGWAVTQDTDRSFQILHTVNGGQKWTTVMSRTTEAPLNGAIIRSVERGNAWIELVGDTGMNQTSYSLWHTADSGQSWRAVLANATAGGGPAPGISQQDNQVPKNEGAAPGMLYAVNSSTAWMGGYCAPCDKPNTIGWTTDSGKTWNNGKQGFDGYGGQQIGMANAKEGWAIFSDSEQAPVMYTTSDGGQHWTQSHVFDKPVASGS
ncbi:MULTISPECIES: hypothetical protein [Paenibacillus]|jgi:photosystem II stability/assembly factor-like uncharacterized protein|uniref:hypothetical protein n=1 Tax=Paenibacillus TaxID=44249 RepID=UPI000947516F|nr:MULTISPECIES: hypothetical protein [Paenibacillus]APQ58245.1 hypothetical protein VK72_05545 [Paenibacillus polymyxa]MCP3744164.1 hypothetical protein [Paenibacillus sp. A3M_27_13]OMF34334.1 hypothetical protein BK134_08110 [Paenibacillus peoriae]VUG06654.1 Ycf48-like protein [Paenibacillus polymyxa]